MEWSSHYNYNVAVTRKGELGCVQPGGENEEMRTEAVCAAEGM